MKRIAYRGIRLAEEGDVWVEDADGMLLPEDEYGLDEDELVEQAEEELEEREGEARRGRPKRAQEHDSVEEYEEAEAERLLEDLNAQPLGGLAEYINRDVLSDPKLTRLLKKLYSEFSEFRVNGADASIPVTGLYPTQNEIGLSNSLAWPLGGKADIASYFSSPITCGKPIVTYNGTYILDGHHRWSQAYVMNPEIEITAIDFTGIDVDPEQVLRDLQGEIAVQMEFVPQSEGDPLSNIYDMSEDDVRTWVDSKLEPDGAIEHELRNELDMDRDEVIEYLVMNAMQLKNENAPVSTAPDRKFMPQTDDIDIGEFDDGSNI